MITNDQIEAYLIETDVPYEEVKEGFWLIHNEDDDVDNVVVFHTAPVITFRVKLMDAPKDNRLALFERLLQLNATSLVSGAFGLEDNAIVIIDSLQSENLDYNEFQASIDAITFAVREHYEELRAFAPVS